ncbi:Uncharacterized protein C13B9.2 [Toxocara canis]|uniref:Uncharacterized protein C13B9.2 n=1 Tax=Toxocara canis TaxID=6265 RepID=A0A0B2VFX3_TOXCA|nr:Uncharacterized protein C13B9.2 [Toxocara canis]
MSGSEEGQSSDGHFKKTSTRDSDQSESDSKQGPSNMNELRSTCIRAFRAAVAAVQPYERVRNALRVTGGQLTVGKRVYQLEHNVHMAAVGKAALGMVQGAEAALGKHLVQGIASVPRHTIKKIQPGSQLITEFFEGATNNLPDEDSCMNAERIENLARHLRDPNDIFLVLLSEAILSLRLFNKQFIGAQVPPGLPTVGAERGKEETVILAAQQPGSQLITEFFEGATNNLPDEDSCMNAERIENLARHLRDPNDIFLVLLSGGGSALLPAPVNSISLADKLATIKAMTSRGAEIKQLNCVRRALSRLKGGKLAEIAHPAKVITVIISDIVGDPIDLIASGPTVLEQHSMLNDSPIKVLKTLNTWEAIPPNVQQALRRANAAKPKSAKIDVNNVIISNNETAIKGVSKTLEESGYSCHTASTTIAEDATLFGEQLASIIVSILSGSKPEEALRSLNMPNINVSCPDGDCIALLFGGETTVTLTGKGKGGRNQQIVLSALSKLLECDDKKMKGEFALLSAGTDGQDGPTEAAGAVLTNDDIKFIRDNGRWEKGDVDGFLNKNDSFNFWKVFRDGACHVHTGPTGTNVMDVQVLLINKKVDIFTL